MFKRFFAILSLASLPFFLFSQTLWLDKIQVSQMEAGWGESRANFSVDGLPLRVAGVKYQRGIGTHAVSRIMFSLDGASVRFSAWVGIDDGAGSPASAEFVVMGDKKVLWRSGVMKKGDPARKAEVSLKGMKNLALMVTDGGDGIDHDHADWLEASIEYLEKAPRVTRRATPKPYLLTPPAGEGPRINYPRVTGATPGKPFLFSIPATGKAPLQYQASGLPEGLSLDRGSGIITGTCPAAGTYPVWVRVSNATGSDTATFILKAGAGLALTPPMGWNSWNCWGLNVDAGKIVVAAQEMATRLKGHGWTYVNIDDGWEAGARTQEGVLPGNDRFPDMKKLCDEVHALGLKIGIYSSPGEKTCGGFAGSWGYERKDADTWAAWGFDYLKYDWCSYGEKANNAGIPELKKPYLAMRDALRVQPRDIVFSLCQYGMGNVWEWGESVHGNLWRTTGDIVDTWKSVAGIGFSQADLAPYAGPGHWNDPDMLVVGKLGWGKNLRMSRLSPDEQYSHITLWSLLAAPLLLGCDLTQLDDFTLNLLTNDEVIAVNQDPKGAQARRVSRASGNEVWVKELEDKSFAVGFFYIRTEAEGEAAGFQWEDDPKPARIRVNWAQLGVSGRYRARDLWQQKDLGTVHEVLEVEVPWHGCRLIRLSPF